MGQSYSQTTEPLLSKDQSQPSPQPPNYKIYDYVVQPGDTLFSIAYNFGVSIHLLKSINMQLNQDGTLFPEDVVCVPLKSDMDPCFEIQNPFE